MNTRKYLEVVHLILKGYSTQEIAKKLHYSIGTVRNIYEALRKKYNVNTKTGIALAYIGDELKTINKKIENFIDCLTGVK